MSYNAGTRMATGPSATNIPKSAVARGDLDDSKYYELGYTLAANETKKFEVDASALYVDAGPTNNTDVSFTVDDCFPLMALRYGLFIRIRRFTTLTLKNNTGVAKSGHIIYSRNPLFLAIQSQAV